MRKRISQSLDIETDTWGNSIPRGSRDIFLAYQVASQAIQDDQVKVGNLAQAGREIAAALPGCESIDDLLERHAGNQLYEIAGKLGIAENILKAEQQSPLRQNINNITIPSISGFSQHWLARFLQAITKRVPKDDLKKCFSNLKVINFNYDRCFERFTHLWLRHVYSMTENQANDIASEIRLIHPYGCLGELTVGNAGIPFGYEARSTQLYAISRNILTYSESVDEENRATAIKDAIIDCNTLVFLGFAFHGQNMNLLNVGGGSGSRTVYATAVGMPLPKWEMAKVRIANCLRQNQNDAGMYIVAWDSCEELVQHYSERWVD